GRVADAGAGETPQPPHPPGRQGGTSSGRAVSEGSDSGHLPLAVLTEPHPLSCSHGAREHADIGDLLSRWAPLDLEDETRSRTVDVPLGWWQQRGDAIHQRTHTCAGERRTEEHGMYEHSSGLRGELLAELPVRNAPLVVDVRSQDRVVLFGEQLGQPVREHRVDAVPSGEVATARSEL